MSVVIVTGAGSGIGAATCRLLASRGYDLVVHSRTNEEGLSSVMIDCDGVRTERVLGDLQNSATVENLLLAAQRLGRLYGVVANAGFADARALQDLDDPAMERSLGTMVVSLAHLMRLSLASLKDSGEGRFVAVSSFVAHRFNLGGQRFPASAAAKAGIEALVKSAAIEVAPFGITVNAVAPGYVRKDRAGSGALRPEQLNESVMRVPMGRMAIPADVAGPVGFLLSPEAAYITGHVLRVDGGLTL